jgi:hypothetical protein
MINDEDLLAGGDGGDVSNFSELDEKQLLAGDEM